MEKEILDRDLNSLEILLLMYVDLGLTGPYELSAHAGMGASLSSPGLKRLEAYGLLVGTRGPRKSTRYTITERGKVVLGESLWLHSDRHWFGERHTLFESGSRSILLASLYTGHEAGHYCVDWASDELELQSEQKAREAADLLKRLRTQREKFENDQSRFNKGILIATAHRWLKSMLDASLLKMESAAVRGIHDFISELPNGLPDLPGDEDGELKMKP
jgi:DNA-binding PadR family transcriptional regulator